MSAEKSDVATTSTDHAWADRQQMLIRDAQKKMAEINGTPVTYQDDWIHVKEKMKASGWNYWHVRAPLINGVPIGGDDFVWLLPTGKTPKEGGTLGIDFLPDEMAARKFAVDHFHWCGEFQGIEDTCKSPSSQKPESSRHRTEYVAAPAAPTLPAVSAGSQAGGERQNAPEIGRAHV